MWRQDNRGWYQLLRKLRKDYGPSTTSSSASAAATKGTNNAPDSFRDGSVLSLQVHPDKMKGLLLVLSRQPATLKVLNLATYKPVHACEQFSGLSAYLVREHDSVFSTGVFHRAHFSADGKYIVCCCNVSSSATFDKPIYKLLVWDTYTGQRKPSLLSGTPHIHSLVVVFYCDVRLFTLATNDMSFGSDLQVYAAVVLYVDGCLLEGDVFSSMFYVCVISVFMACSTDLRLPRALRRLAPFPTSHRRCYGKSRICVLTYNLYKHVCFLSTCW